MSIITLTTDYGIKDHFAASVKGRVLSAIPSVRIVDISHCIDLYNIAAASYVLFGAYKNFPKETIHWVLVEAEMYDQTSFLLTKFDGHYFLTANNGIISLFATESDEIEIIDLEIPGFCLDTVALYTYISQKIIAGSTMDQFGTKMAYQDCEQLVELRAKVSDDGNSIRGAVIYEDHYGNAVTNITKELFLSVQNSRKYTINASRHRISRINKFYADFNTQAKQVREYEGEMMFIFNDLDFLQMAIYKSNPDTVGNVRTLFGLSYRDTIIVEFNE